MNTTFDISTICTAFDKRTVGTKVLGDGVDFLAALRKAVAKHDWSSGIIPGQAILPLPEVLEFISCGNRPVEGLTDEDLVGRIHRRVPGVYARRYPSNPPAKTCSVVVYTKDAYNSDPDVIKEGGRAGKDYVIVAVLSSCEAPQEGQSLSYPPVRLVHNIAGGNNAFIPRTTQAFVNKIGAIILPPLPIRAQEQTGHDLQLLLHRIIDECKASKEAAERLILVAD